MTEETGASSFLFSLLPICWRRLPPPGAGQFPQLWRLSGSAPCPWDTTRETALGTALDKWQLRALFCQSRQALAAKPGKCGRVPSPGVPFPVTNKERAVSFWNQQLSFFFFLQGVWVRRLSTYCVSSAGLGGSCQTYCEPSAGLGATVRHTAGHQLFWGTGIGPTVCHRLMLTLVHHQE